MTAQASGDEHDPDDPAEILRRLPEKYHVQFRADYAEAVEQARRPEQYRMLHHLLRLWRLRSLAYSDPGYLERMTVAASDAATEVPAEQLIVGWPGR